MGLSGILGHGNAESGSCTSLGEEAEHLLAPFPVTLTVPCEAQVVVIEPGSEALDRPAQIVIRLQLYKHMCI